MYKVSQHLNFTNFKYLHETKMLYLYFKGKDTPFCVILFIMLCTFQKVSFHFEKNALFKTHVRGGTVGHIEDLEHLWNHHEKFYNLSFVRFFANGILKRAVMNQTWYCNNARPSHY